MTKEAGSLEIGGHLEGGPLEIWGQLDIIHTPESPVVENQGMLKVTKMVKRVRLYFLSSYFGYSIQKI